MPTTEMLGRCGLVVWWRVDIGESVRREAEVDGIGLRCPGNAKNKVSRRARIS